MNLQTKGVTSLLAANIGIFVAGLLLPSIDNWITYNLRLFFPQNQHFEVWQFVSHMFLHGGPAHILFNMFALFSFGTVLERIWGTKKFITFYFVSGIGASLIYTGINYFEFESIRTQLTGLGLNEKQITFLLSNNYSVQGIETETLKQFYSIFNASMLGASGAVYGVLVAFGISFPNAKLSLMFLPVPISAKVLTHQFHKNVSK
ncbi:rhomboid family intramembrane serine protease [Puniceicoccaceae bacterium K14]|nr:rhomboid family intramembrane serine protease [Puniceicoccaceae bacterium K14]